MFWMAVILTFSFNTFAQEDFNSIDMEITDSIYGAGDFRIPCQIEDTSQSCKIDTGAPFSIFSNLAPKSNITLINQVNYTSVSGQSSTCQFLQSETSLLVGRNSIEQPAYFSCPNSNSNFLLGLNHLMKSAFTLDVKNKKFISNSELNILDSSYNTDPSGHILVEVEIIKSGVRKKIIAMLDTGASVSVINKDLILENPDFFTLINGTFEGLKDTLDNSLQNTLAMVNGIQIDQKRIAAPYAVAIDFKSMNEEIGFRVDMIIGANVIKEMNSISINPLNQTWSAD